MCRIVATRAPAATLLVRLMVGGVFLSEGLQKFLYAAQLGAGRMARIGIPAPEAMGPLVGTVEIVAGVLVLLGLLTRPGATALWIVISVAIASTKVPILLGRGYWIFAAPKPGLSGFWAMAHEARTDYCMWLGSLFLIIVGAGAVSFDALLSWRKSRRQGTPEPPPQSEKPAGS